jgi:hypothetical protein
VRGSELAARRHEEDADVGDGELAADGEGDGEGGGGLPRGGCSGGGGGKHPPELVLGKLHWSSVVPSSPGGGSGGAGCSALRDGGRVSRSVNNGSGGRGDGGGGLPDAPWSVGASAKSWPVGASAGS